MSSKAAFGRPLSLRPDNTQPADATDMLRITELRLPLNHPEPALREAVLARLGIADAALRGFTLFRRGYDARRKSAIVLVYTLDCEVDGESGGADHGNGGGGEELLGVHDEFLQYRLFDVSGQGGLVVVCRLVQPR